MTEVLHLFDLLGVAVFAASGALVASRKQMDLAGFWLLAAVTAIGGGTLRDLILDRPVFWAGHQSYLLVCLAVATLVYFTGHLPKRRYFVLLWMDALGLSAYAVLGAQLAHAASAAALPAVVLGTVTATFGGLIRDVIGGETPLILGQEVYATAALAAAATHLGLVTLGIAVPIASLIGFCVGFAVRGGGIAFGWKLPRYKSRPGREPRR